MELHLLLHGINLATTRIVSEELATSNIDRAKYATKICIVFSLFSGICAGLIFSLNASFIVNSFLHNKVKNSVIYFISIALPFISMSAAVNGYFTAIRKVYKNVLGQFAEQITKIICSAYILNLFLPNGLQYACISLIIGDCISEIVSFLYLYFLYSRDIKKYNSNIMSTNNSSYNKIFLRKIITIILPVAITSYIKSGLASLKQLIIPLSLEKSGLSCEMSLSQVGAISGMVLPIILFFNVFSASFGSLLIPELSSYYVKKDYKKSKQITILSLLLSTVFSLLIALLIIAFSEKICNTIYNDTSISIYLKILAPISILIFLDTVVDCILKGLNAQVSVMFINVIDLTITLAFIYFLVPSLGTKGYLLSIFISELTNLSLSLVKLFFVIKKSNSLSNKLK